MPYEYEGVMMRGYVRLIALLPLVLLSAVVAAGERPPLARWEPSSQWRQVELAGSGAPMPVRLVGEDEPWEYVVQDVQASRRGSLPTRPVRVGFYGHGAFVTSAQWPADLLFVAALGRAADLDVMLFPRWRFPEQHPLVALPWHLLQAQLNTAFKHPAATVVDTVKRQGRQFARANQYATAHAALRLAEGLSTFHAQHMTPSLAAFSNSALVTVRLGQLIESGRITDGYEDIAVAESVRQHMYLTNIVTFGYPLPNGQVSAAFRQRVHGTWVNVVPAECWKQWGANFLLQGVENLPVSWAPAHADWPRLSPQSPEVTVLGALLGGRSDVWQMPSRTQRSQARAGEAPSVQWVWENLCETMQRFDLMGAVDGPS
jgi:hypothetical protein